MRMTLGILKVILCMCLIQPGGMASRGQHIVDCPMLCRCLEKGSIITCRHAGLHHLPTLLTTTMFLDFDDNHLTVLRNGTFVAAHRVEMLSLQNNQLQTIEEGTLSLLTDLHTLLLGGNLLSSLPADIFRYYYKIMLGFNWVTDAICNFFNLI